MAQGPAQTARAKLLKQTRVRGKPLAADSVIEAKRATIGELIANGKAIAVDASTPLKEITEIAPPVLAEAIARRRARANVGLVGDVDKMVEERVAEQLKELVPAAVEAAMSNVEQHPELETLLDPDALADVKQPAKKQPAKGGAK